MQEDSINCGVFVCMFAYALSTGKDMQKTFRSEEMEVYRRRIAWMFTDVEVSDNKYL